MSLWEKIFGVKKSPRTGLADNKSVKRDPTSNPQPPLVPPTLSTQPKRKSPAAPPIEAHNQSRVFLEAASSGNVERVLELLRDNPDLILCEDNVYGATALHWAAGNGRKKVAEILLANRAAINAREGEGRTPLHLAAFNGHKDVVELLLDKKADVNAKDQHGKTPLHSALIKSHVDVVALLLANGAEGMAKRNEDSTLAHRAANGDKHALAELLFAGRADANAKIDKDGHALLHEVAKNGNRDVAEFLLALKADVDARDNSSHTPLHIAAASGQMDIAKMLLANKADVNAKQCDGGTPLIFAGLNRQGALAELLLANKAEFNVKGAVDGISRRNMLSVISTLGQRGLGEPAADALAAAVCNGDGEIRLAAVDALHRLKIGDGNVISALVAAINDHNDEVRFRAIYAVNDLAVRSGKATDAVKDALVAAMGNGSEKVRVAAGAVLENLNYSPTDTAARVVYYISRGFTDKLREIGEPATDGLIRCLRYDFPTSPDGVPNGPGDALYDGLYTRPARLVRCAAVEALTELKGAEAYGTLTPLLCDNDAEVRIATIKAIVKLNLAQTHAALLPLLCDKSAGVRVAAINAIGQVDFAEARAALTPLLNDVDSEVRVAVIEVLEKLGRLDADAIRQILPHIRPPWNFRSEEIEALGKFRVREAVDVIVQCLNDFVAPRTKRSGRKLNYPTTEIEEQAKRAAIATLIVCFGEDARIIEPVTRATRYHSDEVLLEVIDRVAGSKENYRFEWLARIVLNATDKSVLDKGAKALIALDQSRTLDAMITSLRERTTMRDEAQSPAGAAYTLGLIGDSRVVDPLVTFVNSKYYEWGEGLKYAIAALKNINDPRAIAPLRAFLKEEPQTHLKLIIANALASLGDTWIFEWLLALPSGGILDNGLESSSVFMEEFFRSDVPLTKVPTSSLERFARLENQTGAWGVASEFEGGSRWRANYDFTRERARSELVRRNAH